MIPYGRHFIDEEDIQAVVDVLRSGSLTQGPAIELFECTFADYVGAKYAVAVSSGTAALHLSAIAAGLDSDSTMVTSPITFVATANSALYVGAKIEFVDVDPRTINMDPVRLEEVLKSNPKTKAVVPVHFSGLPCDMGRIKTLADKCDAIVIEDAAHALGATYPNGKRVGCCENSLMTCFSFHPVKVITSGEGGLITTNDYGVYRRLLRLRSHGIQKLDDVYLLRKQAETEGVNNPWYYEMQELGFHYRTTDIQCALALSQLSKIEKFITRRRELANNYDNIFKPVSHIRRIQENGRHLSAHHLYVVELEFDKLSVSRASLMSKLRMHGIGTQVHYIPVPLHPVYSNLGHDMRELNNSYEYYNQALSIPLFYALKDEEQQFISQKIINIIEESY